MEFTWTLNGVGQVEVEVDENLNLVSVQDEYEQNVNLTTEQHDELTTYANQLFAY